MKHLTFKKKYKVTMILQCRPSLVDHLLDEFDSTAQYENALIETYSFEELNESEFKSDD
jgi:hypothetical protein